MSLFLSLGLSYLIIGSYESQKLLNLVVFGSLV